METLLIIMCVVTQQPEALSVCAQMRITRLLLDTS